MIIKIIPEEGETHIQEVEHKHIHDFFMFGNKKDADGDFVDFHDWKGSYRYLMSSLAYFNEVIKDERTTSSTSTQNPVNVIKSEIELKPPTKDIETVIAEVEEAVEGNVSNVSNVSNIIPLEIGDKDKIDTDVIEIDVKSDEEE